MSKIQIAIIILAVVAIIAVPTVTFFTSSAAPKPTHDEHEFTDTWKTDATSHWKSCTGAGCTEVSEKAEHAYGEGVVTTEPTEAEEGVTTYTCTVCGYAKLEHIAKLEHVHTYESNWTNDATHHWHASTCGHEDGEKEEHVFDDGFIEKQPTDSENGLIVYTCAYCGYSYEEELTPTTHYHVYETEWTYDDNSHWHASACGHANIKDKANHTLGEGKVIVAATEYEEGLRVYPCKICGYEKEEAIPKLAHVHNFVDGVCRCGLDHIACSACNKCAKEGCTECAEQCVFTRQNYVVPFAPNATYLGDPEGPNGIKPGDAGSYVYDRTIQASFVVLEDGAHATKVTLPNGAAGHSGVSFWSNQNFTNTGMAGYNVNVPQYQNVATPIRMYFTNTGDSELLFKFSFIDYWYDKGAVTVQLAPGESKVVEFTSTFANDTVGLNNQIVFLQNAEKGASLTIWGEFVADTAEYLTIAVPADKLSFKVGDTFTAEGLILNMNRGSTDGKTNLYNRIYITDNYTTNLDGHVFTEADALAGKKTVTVSFAGKTITYDITMADHDHNLTLVKAVSPVACTTEGTESYYQCSIAGCGKMFSDSAAIKQITSPTKIPCHTAPTGDTVYPGTTVKCTKCQASMIAPVTENWVLFSISTQATVGSNIKNGKIEHAEVNGVPGTKVSIGAGTVGATNNSAFYLQMTNNDAGYQTVIPNVTPSAPSGSVRKIVMHYVNYSDVQITMNLQNDAGSSYAMAPITIPANGTASVTFDCKFVGGSNWFYYFVDCSPTKDVSFGVYGYFYVYDQEVSEVSIAKNANQATFKVGERFSTEGLIVNATLPSGSTKTAYAATGYTTDLDGYIFTAADIGTKTVTVDFGGKKVTYKITITE